MRPTRRCRGGDSNPIPEKKDDVQPDRTEVVAAHARLLEWKTEMEETTP
jgi:hypothetical protein